MENKFKKGDRVVSSIFGPGLDNPDDIPVAKLTSVEDQEWCNKFAFYCDEGWSEKDADRLAWLEMQNEYPRLMGKKFSKKVEQGT